MRRWRVMMLWVWLVLAITASAAMAQAPLTFVIIGDSGAPGPTDLVMTDSEGNIIEGKHQVKDTSQGPISDHLQLRHWPNSNSIRVQPRFFSNCWPVKMSSRYIRSPFQ